MMRLLSFKTGIMLLIALLYCTVGFATPTEKTYDVQILVFSHITANTLSLEQWPVIQTPTPSNQSQNPPQKNAYALQAEKGDLLRDPNYDILFDGSWQASWQEGSTIQFPIVSIDGKLNGTVAITLGHYFDVNTQLFLSEPISLLQKINATPYFNQFSQSDFTFKLAEDRRMRSNELDYFEHPLMGMLIKIIPIKNENTTQ